MALILSGKEAATAIKANIKEQVDARIAAGGNRPHLAAILVGDNPASAAYVRGKVRDCDQVGFESTLVKMPTEATEKEVLAEIEKLNANPDVSGFIVQLPLPDHIDDDRVLMAIDPSKDVDGFHPESVGRMALGLPTFLPATPYGILMMLEHFNIETSGKRAVVVGRSNIVGSPMSILLSRNSKVGNATVTLAHSRTQDLEGLCKEADIIVAAIGRPGFITADHVGEGAVVIDVGINRVNDKLVGDVAFDEVEPIASAITPVPGGVGLMTRVGLLMNTLQATDER